MDYRTRREEFSWLFLVGGLALGALAMFVSDPPEGPRLRALLQDKVNSATHKTSKLMDRFIRNAHNRLLGLQAQARLIIGTHPVKPIDDHVLEARVRSRLGREIPQFEKVQISASEGTISLAGNITAEEESRLLGIVESIPGVEAVQHNLAIGPVINPVRHTHWSVADTVSVVCAVSAGLWVWYRLTREPTEKTAKESSAHKVFSGEQRELGKTSTREQASKHVSDDLLEDQGDVLH